MSSLWERVEPLLARVQKPARYIGCEDGAITSRYAPGKVSWLLAYPDTYEIGLPNQGLQILYDILNDRDDAVAERIYAPWVDLEALMSQRDVPLFSVDSHRAAGEFDLFALNLSSELDSSNLFNMVDLAGIPVRSAQRSPEHPLVVIGGCCAFNSEPLADFVDLVVLGDGEAVFGEITEVVRDWKLSRRTPGSRERVLRALARVEGVYVPSMRAVGCDGPALRAVNPRSRDVPAMVHPRIVADLSAWPYPRRPLVPPAGGSQETGQDLGRGGEIPLTRVPPRRTNRLATTSRGLRPLELIAALLPAPDPVDVTARVLRTHQWIDGNGAYRELLPVDAVAARPLGERE